MKPLFAFLLFFIFFEQSFSLYSEDQESNPLHLFVVIPSYNNEKWCIKNIESIAAQIYPYWSACYINDCSTDNTGLLVEQYIQDNNLQEKIHLIHNKERRGMLANTYLAIQMAKPDWVVLTVDGDDYLLYDKVFDYVANVYSQNNDVWLTYGNWISDPPGHPFCHCKPFPEEVLRENSFRKWRYNSHHLRTFYAGLFQQIAKEDLMNEGEFFPSAGDVAYMMPMLEMASKGHIHFIKKKFYVYNVANPINDSHNRPLQAQCSKIIRKRLPYTPLEKPIWRSWSLGLHTKAA